MKNQKEDFFVLDAVKKQSIIKRIKKECLFITVRIDPKGGLIHTNTAESINNIVRSTLRRYRSVAKKNLPLYLSEMIFKLYNKKSVVDIWGLT